ncbi:PotD/PotF family extracellular solute-binding protein [Massilia sp. CF038]|uniref:ABC transporter substrate-binding protein n=1 Tax=Massilia sp. CF038 TaxID=1881045 RepID=UPI00091E02D1|nr:ABC transporter substrate-binding protein [Massilia sp. CF038]SHG75328.1 Spermidine/putrescine-binding protein [Massilia sp. CF038]
MRSLVIVLTMLSCVAAPARGADVLRIFAWQGYVTAQDVAAVNRLLQQRGIDVTVAMSASYAQGPEQMFQVMRQNGADLSFLTVNYIQMQDGRIGRQLQPVDVARLKNYRHTLPQLRALPMGMSKGRPLYVPFGGGAYGIWANMDQLKAAQLPRRLHDLLAPQWKHHLALSAGQVQPNVALAYMASGQPPFVLDDLVRQDRRERAKQELVHSEARTFLRALYGQVAQFWYEAPQFPASDWLVASYGPEISERRARGERWRMVQFEEGNTVWLDTMNLHKNVQGAKLAAAYLFMDYMLSNAVQQRVVHSLNMVAVTRTVDNPLLRENPNFFRSSHFWPPYTKLSDNLMRAMSDQAMPKRQDKGRQR